MTPEQALADLRDIAALLYNQEFGRWSDRIEAAVAALTPQRPDGTRQRAADLANRIGHLMRESSADCTTAEWNTRKSALLHDCRTILTEIAAANPQRPDRVPEHAVPVTLWLDGTTASGTQALRTPNGNVVVWLSPKFLRRCGVVVPDPPTPQRTGPHGLSERPTRLVAALDMNDPQYDADDCVFIKACRRAVAGWDTETQR